MPGSAIIENRDCVATLERDRENLDLSSTKSMRERELDAAGRRSDGDPGELVEVGEINAEGPPRGNLGGDSRRREDASGQPREDLQSPNLVKVLKWRCVDDVVSHIVYPA